MSYFLWRVKEGLIYVFVSLNEQKFSIATVHLGEYQGEKIPPKWMTSLPLLKNLWWFCCLLYSFCCWGNSVANMLAFCFVSQICCGVFTSVAFMPLSRSSPTRHWKRSKSACHEWFSHNPHMKMTGEPRCPGETLPHLTSQSMMDMSHGCVNVVLGGLGDWKGWFPLW